MAEVWQHSAVMIAPLIDSAALEVLVAENPQVVVADVRWYLDGRAGGEAFVAGHIPGAVFLDLDNDLSRHPAEPADGRHPFAIPEAFANTMASVGIGNDSIVVAYDDTGGMTAGRLVVMLRMQGCQAALLDGGLAAWSGPLEAGPRRAAQTATFYSRPWPADRFATADELADLESNDGTMALDARSAERYSGSVAAIDPTPGHIPRAANSPWASVLDPDTKRLRSPNELRSHFEELGVDQHTDVVHYCGSGVSACINMIAMEIAGFAESRLYVASWSGWSSDPQRPTKTGSER